MDSSIARIYLKETENKQTGQKTNPQVGDQKRKTTDATPETRQEYLVCRKNEKPVAHKKTAVMGRHMDSLTREMGERKALAEMLTRMVANMQVHHLTRTQVLVETGGPMGTTLFR